MSSKHCFRNLSCLEKSTKKLKKIKKIFFSPFRWGKSIHDELPSDRLKI